MRGGCLKTHVAFKLHRRSLAQGIVSRMGSLESRRWFCLLGVLFGLILMAEKKHRKDKSHEETNYKADNAPEP